MSDASGLNSIEISEHIGVTATGDNINAKRVAGYYWDGANWQRNPTPPTVGPNGGQYTTSVPLATQLDSTTTNITYVGKAPTGTATSAAAWQVFKMDETTPNTLIITWANGNSTFTNIWDNRASLSYS